MKKQRLMSVLWIVLILADYYLQFFSNRYWTDHALPFLHKLALR